MTAAQTHTVWQGKVRIRVHSKGSGPALVFFHGPWGLTWDPFLDELAKGFTVYAPEHPGTTPEAPEDVHHLDGLWDLVLCYDELLTALGLERVAMVGHSFGGMMAAEMAAAYPRRVDRVALIAPIGFWREREPVVNWNLLEADALRRHLFHEPDREAARQMFGPAEPAAAAAAARVRLLWSMGATAKFTWPLPDKGLKKRIHRISAPTLLIWGKEDRLVPPVYADEFLTRLPGARLETVDRAGHAPQIEQPEAVARLVGEFLRP